MFSEHFAASEAERVGADFDAALDAALRAVLLNGDGLSPVAAPARVASSPLEVHVSHSKNRLLLRHGDCAVHCALVGPVAAPHKSLTAETVRKAVAAESSDKFAATPPVVAETHFANLALFLCVKLSRLEPASCASAAVAPTLARAKSVEACLQQYYNPTSLRVYAEEQERQQLVALADDLLALLAQQLRGAEFTQQSVALLTVNVLAGEDAALLRAAAFTTASLLFCFSHVAASGGAAFGVVCLTARDGASGKWNRSVFPSRDELQAARRRADCNVLLVALDPTSKAILFFESAGCELELEVLQHSLLHVEAAARGLAESARCSCSECASARREQPAAQTNGGVAA